MNENEKYTADDFKHQARINKIEKWVLNVCFICDEPNRYFFFDRGKVFLKTDCMCSHNVNEPVEQDWDHVKNVYYSLTHFIDKVHARKVWGF